jgi:hypothetical protein
LPTGWPRSLVSLQRDPIEIQEIPAIRDRAIVKFEWLLTENIAGHAPRAVQCVDRHQARM